jgi:cyclopropane fatty-acyl-phospholipid synthase-like methyltransferase
VVRRIRSSGISTSTPKATTPRFAGSSRTTTTCSEWIERYERRYEQAVAYAGEERARVWRLYLHAARQGFTTGWASIYQVLARRP